MESAERLQWQEEQVRTSSADGSGAEWDRCGDKMMMGGLKPPSKSPLFSQQRGKAFIQIHRVNIYPPTQSKYTVLNTVTVRGARKKEEEKEERAACFAKSDKKPPIRNNQSFLEKAHFTLQRPRNFTEWCGRVWALYFIKKRAFIWDILNTFNVNTRFLIIKCKK